MTSYLVQPRQGIGVGEYFIMELCNNPEKCRIGAQMNVKLKK
jgi:hypothetical protein